MTLVSVITPTWQRHQLLLDRCIPSVRGQTWPDVEHIIVSDGPDPELADLLAGEGVSFHELPEHVEGGTVDYGSRARNHGLAHAKGDVIAYLDDDNAWRSEHLAMLVAALESGVDFVYSQMLCHPRGGVIGSHPPAYGSIDTSLIAHRRGLPEDFGMWPLPDEIAHPDRHAPDWGVVSRWLEHGATWIHVPTVTADYHFHQ